MSLNLMDMGCHLGLLHLYVSLPFIYSDKKRKGNDKRNLWVSSHTTLCLTLVAQRLRSVSTHDGSFEDESLDNFLIILDFHGHLSNHLSYPSHFLFFLLRGSLSFWTYGGGSGSIMRTSFSGLGSIFSSTTLKSNFPLFILMSSLVSWSSNFLFLFGISNKGPLV